MGLVIRVPRRLRRSRRFTFDDAVERVVVGRDPDRCQIMFPPRMRTVGLEHLALERVLGHYRLVLNAEDPVFVNGREALDGEELPDRCVLRLGENGPRLVVERTTRTDLPPVERAAASHGHTAAPRAVLASVRANRKVATTAAVLVVLVAGFLVWSTWRSDPDDAPTDEATLRAALEQAAPSVYRVVVRTADGGEYSGATAWVVAPHRLATNAHVARQLEQLPAGGRLQVRSSEADPRTYDVVAVTIHPGFEAFEALWDGYQPAEGVRAGRLNRIRSAGAGADVALLDVEPKVALGRPLPLADEATLFALVSGDRVGYVGYPSESLALQGSPVKRPVAHRQLGRITLVTNFFGASGAPASNQLIQHTCPGTGGSSGSPLLDARGHVVGVVSAGNFAPGMMGRIPTGVGINFAQRVDLLRELLEGHAEERQAERSKEWTACIEDLYPSAWRIGRRQAIDRHLRELSNAHQLRTDDAEYLAWTLVSTRVVAAGVEPPPDEDRVAIEVLQGGRHVLLAAPRLEREAVMTATFVPEVGARSEHAARDGALEFEASGSGILHVAATAVNAAVPVELLLYHGQPRPLTPAILRERVLADWVGELEQRPYLRLSTEPTVLLEEEQRLGSTDGATPAWRRTLSCTQTGLYLILAVARENEGITLGVSGLEGPLGGHLPTLSRGRRRFEVRQGWGAEGVDAGIRIERDLGVADDVTVELTVWVAASIR